MKEICLCDPEKKLFLSTTKNKPEIVEIFRHLKLLNYEDRPNYSFIKIQLDSLRVQEINKNSPLKMLNNNYIIYDFVKKSFEESNSKDAQVNYDNNLNVLKSYNFVPNSDNNVNSNCENSSTLNLENLLARLTPDRNVKTSNFNKISLFNNVNKQNKTEIENINENDAENDQKNSPDQMIKKKRLRSESSQELSPKKNSLEADFLNYLTAKHSSSNNNNLIIQKLQENLLQNTKNNTTEKPKKKIQNIPFKSSTNVFSGLDDKALINSLRLKDKKKNSLSSQTLSNMVTNSTNRTNILNTIKDSLNKIQGEFNLNGEINISNNIDNFESFRKINSNLDNINNFNILNSLNQPANLANPKVATHQPEVQKPGPYEDYATMINKINEFRYLRDMTVNRYNNVNFYPNFMFGNIYCNTFNDYNPYYQNSNLFQKNITGFEALNSLRDQLNKQQSSLFDVHQNNFGVYQNLLQSMMTPTNVNPINTNLMNLDVNKDLLQLLNEKPFSTNWNELYRTFNM